MTRHNIRNKKAVLFFIALLFSSFTIIAQDNTNYSSTEIIYGRKDGMALTMFIVTPKQNAKGKAIVSVISGNWNSNFSMSSRYMMRSMYLVNNGFTVFFVMHGSQPRYAINDEVADVKRAVRFIRYNAKEYGIDAEHIGISGSSSGGHLSLMVSLSDDKTKFSTDPVDKVSSRVQAAAVFFPPTDFLNWGASNAGMNMQALKRAGVAGAFDFKVLSDSTGVYEHIKDDATLKILATENSPVNNVSNDDPPVLILHGDADPVVPLQQSQTIIKKLKDAGIKNELIIKPGGKHGWPNDKSEEDKIVKWFDENLK